MVNGKFAISTARLNIREICMADDICIFHATSCPQISLMHNNEFHDIVNVRGYITVLMKEYSMGKYRTLAIADNQTDRLIGLITLDVEDIFKRAELSYWIERDCRNTGYATEAVKAIVMHGFTVLGLNRIQAMHFTDNPASGRVLEKAGMLYEGTLRQYVGMNGSFFDCKMYSIIKSDFNQALY